MIWKLINQMSKELLDFQNDFFLMGYFPVVFI